MLVLDLAWGFSKVPDQDDLRGDAWVRGGIRKGCMGKRCIVHMALDACSMNETTVASLRHGFFGLGGGRERGLIGGYSTPSHVDGYSLEYVRRWILRIDGLQIMGFSSSLSFITYSLMDMADTFRLGHVSSLPFLAL